jgi:molybdopterin-guanine dinucleotide biosynthesis protein A
VPAALADLRRLSDVPEADGPIAGILSAMRWAPHASWLVSACDLPNLSVDALRWLLSTRSPGVWATVPKLPGSPGAEPLLAHYDFRARPCLEDLVREATFRPAAILRTPQAISPSPPPGLIPAWTNVNTRSELGSCARGAAAGGSRP